MFRDQDNRNLVPITNLFSHLMSKADIDFEKELWDAVNELRGAVSENNYKNNILPLIFAKHLSERYEVVPDELKEQLNGSASDYYTTDKEEII
ncbi:type I restriction-modification system subunit M N-terminal domain-containing protein [Antarcticibacterium sp. 1MA-6-2]|uniref:type I restriction-modification system subunit M N-terminal domain-containing protein n=1 Tax=Antarcticibacterium sp. 1MA-6-2 TaxID=2908210 RepID=UPI001F28998D|nr:type I restriction-modification system subunit M N-terminal domain-containing protein [Antarcticibacterium sp. 1MA-6-2]UJH91426.1 type I restriction-modification system subunit M N-terminal domain-containing protein [Antarcticibacterium sp. 1MA-6-2]